jgi:hypothetical protein
MTDPVTLERRLISQELRVLFSRIKDNTFSSADAERLPELLAALANGDVVAAESAFARLVASLNQPDSSTMDALLDLFVEGRIDVAGIRDGELAWTLTAAEAAAQEARNG